MAPWCSVITNTELHSTEPEFKFSTSSNCVSSNPRGYRNITKKYWVLKSSVMVIMFDLGQNLARQIIEIWSKLIKIALLKNKYTESRKMNFTHCRSHSLEFYDVFTKNRFLPVKFNIK